MPDGPCPIYVGRDYDPPGPTTDDLYRIILRADGGDDPRSDYDHTGGSN